MRRILHGSLVALVFGMGCTINPVRSPFAGTGAGIASEANKPNPRVTQSVDAKIHEKAPASPSPSLTPTIPKP